MAKYVRELTGDFGQVLSFCDHAIRNGSMSASYEDGCDFAVGNVKVATHVYERYSAFGGNRVSLSFTLVGSADKLHLTAITSGGSQAVFFKLNTLGEESFLETLIKAIESRYPIE